MPESRRLLVVADSLVGGLGAVALAHVRWFAAHGWRCTLASPDRPPEELAGIDWVAVPVPGASRELPAMVRARSLLRAAARQTGAEVVHCHGVRSFLIASAALGPRPFVTVHGHGTSPEDPALNATARTAGLRVVPQLAAGAFSVSPLGVRGWEFLPHAGPRLATLERLAFPEPDSTPCFLWLGRLDEVKRADLFVDAIAAVARTSSVRGVIAGDGPRAAEVDAQIAASGAPITRVGWVDDPGAHLAQAWAVVLFSTKEGVPLALEEAMWAGRAVVGSRLPGIEWLVGDGARIIDDDRDAARALLELTDHGRAAALGRQAGDRVRTLLAVDDPWPQVAARYDTWLGRAHRRR
jgi:glycosyltransferase involved in cell wall biosynthesis